MRNLQSEMKRNGISNSDIKNLLKCSDRTVTNKLTGETDFTIPEALKIHKTFFPELRLEYLFSD